MVLSPAGTDIGPAFSFEGHSDLLPPFRDVSKCKQEDEMRAAGTSSEQAVGTGVGKNSV
jgi:hypothetical protein